MVGRLHLHEVDPRMYRGSEVRMYLRCGRYLPGVVLREGAPNFTAGAARIAGRRPASSEPLQVRLDPTLPDEGKDGLTPYVLEHPDESSIFAIAKVSRRRLIDNPFTGRRVAIIGIDEIKVWPDPIAAEQTMERLAADREGETFSLACPDRRHRQHLISGRKLRAQMERSPLILGRRPPSVELHQLE
jgi:hypothetical protein